MTNGYSYINLCSAPFIDKQLSAAADVVNGTDYSASDHGIDSFVGTNNPNGLKIPACRADETRYVVVSSLTGLSEFWCIDSTGVSEHSVAAPPVGEFVCP